MDLYEALKAGTHPEELFYTFQKELDAAKARLEEENKAKLEQEQKEKEDQEYLEECREILIEAIIDYAGALLDDESIETDVLDFNSINQIFLDFENEVKNLSDLTKKIDSIFPKTNQKKTSVKITLPHDKNDDEIIRNWLKNL